MTTRATSRQLTFLKLLLLGGVVALLLGLLPQLMQILFQALTGTLRLVVNLVGMGAIALLLTALLIPVEALGWWAGWYGDPVQTTQQNLGRLQEAAPADGQVSRYVIYLDGIGQAKFDYLPDVERFLDGLVKELPDDILIIRGLMPYSPMNRELTSESRPFSWFWSRIEQLKGSGTGSRFGFIINLRNLFVVAVSADQRYGPIYNRGTAQVIYNSLINHGYVPESGMPITLIGFSGGGQISMGAAPYLKAALSCPIDIISISGVFSGNNNTLKLEHIYHMVGEKDSVERMGPIFFPKRWKALVLSYWNRTQRMGKVSLIHLGPVGHQLPGGVMDPDQFLPDGRSFLQQTIDWVSEILQGKALLEGSQLPPATSNYQRFQAAPFNHPGFYPIRPLPESIRQQYRAIAPWMGRLILPEKDQRLRQAVWFEVHHAPPDSAHLLGRVVRLQWSEDARVQDYLLQVTKDVHFSAQAEHSNRQGVVQPIRLNHWQLVDPLESLAGAHPVDDMVVALPNSVQVQEDEGAPKLIIDHEPIQITGREYGLVKFLAAVGEAVDSNQPPECFRVVHYNKATRQFNGPEENIWMPQAIANQNGTFPFTNRGIEQSPLNETGWYIYGALNHDGIFGVQAIAPRALFQLQADRLVVGRKPIKAYLKQESWAGLAAQKGQISSVVMSQKPVTLTAAADWQEGDRALLVHVYGGIGGQQREPAAKGPVYFGHFAFGVATVVQEPLSDELRFDIVYHQVYTHNRDGLTAGSMHWCRYMGDRQYGWIGIRPTADTLIRFAPFTGSYEDEDGQLRSPLNALIHQLEVMAARYRIGDGSGGTYVGPANNCAQDSNQSLYAALKFMRSSAQTASDSQIWMEQHPDVAARLAQLEQLGKDLKWHLMPFGSARADWEEDMESLGASLEDYPLTTILRGAVSWRTMFPRVASNSITQAFLRQGAIAWMLRTNQLGGDNPDIEPLAPMTF